MAKTESPPPGTDQPQPAAAISRRKVLIGGAATVVVLGGIAAWKFWPRPSTPSESTKMPEAPATPNAPAEAPDTVSMAELMKPQALPDRVLGDAKAPVTIVEYASMTCPHCAHFQETTFPELKKRYIDTGKVRYIFREFPLDNLAAAAFMVARCAGELDSSKYYALIDTMFAQQRTWAVEKPIPPLMAIAKQAGFTEKSFDECLANQKLLSGIEDVRQRAIKDFQVDSTPTFFINGTRKVGALTIDEMAKVIDPMLPKG